MTLLEIIYNVIAGGLLGAIGQVIRVFVGLKKLNETNNAKIQLDETPEPFSWNRILISLLIGFVAGALGMLIKNSTNSFKTLPIELVITIIAIGYSGADFIEGLFKTYASKFSTSSPTKTLDIAKNNTAS